MQNCTLHFRLLCSTRRNTIRNFLPDIFSIMLTICTHKRKFIYLASYCCHNYRYLVTQIFSSKAEYERFEVGYGVKQKRSYYLLNRIGITHCLLR